MQIFFHYDNLFINTSFDNILPILSKDAIKRYYIFLLIVKSFKAAKIVIKTHHSKNISTIFKENGDYFYADDGYLYHQGNYLSVLGNYIELKGNYLYVKNS